MEKYMDNLQSHMDEKNNNLETYFKKFFKIQE